MTNSLVHSVAGLVFYSPNAPELARFYRALGVPLAQASHGTVGNHLEGMVERVHVAVWDDQQGHGHAGLVPVFRTLDLANAERTLLERGAARLHKPIDLGEGKRVVGFADPDGRPFRLIEISEAG